MQESDQPRHLCPHSSCALSWLKGFSNGVTFGVKVRFTHAVVIALLFRTGSLYEKLSYVLKLTIEHAGRLGCFVALYKCLQCILTRLHGRMHPLHSFIAGAIGGFLLFGSKTLVTTQVVLYLLGRVVAGSVKLILKPLELPKSVSRLLFPLTSVACWAFVMFLFQVNQKVLQPSLASSMRLLYVQSDSWKSWVEFVPFGTTFASILKS